MNKNNEPTVTLEECLQEFSTKSQLKALEEEYAQRKADIEMLRSIEQNLRMSIIQFSNTLSQLYAMAGTLVLCKMPEDEE